MKQKINIWTALFWVAVLTISGTAITSYKSSKAVFNTNLQGGQVGDVPKTQAKIQAPTLKSDNVTDSKVPQTSGTSTQVPGPTSGVSSNMVNHISPTATKPSINRVRWNEDGSREFEDD